MSQRVEKLAVLFADICGSTALYENLGDDKARQLISRCIGTMTGALPAHQGKLIKTIGDEILCTFPDAEAAFHGACAIQAAVKKSHASGETPLYVRVGFHYGDVICEQEDIFGDTVNVAARIAAITRAGQIMTTKAVVDVLPQGPQEKIRHIFRAEIKGKQDQFDMYVVVWEQDDMMSTRVGIPAFRKSPDNIDELVLRYRGQSFRINRERRRAMMGRDEACDIIVPGNLVSRQHAGIELRSGKFIMTDQSTNGTYARFADGHVVHITREELILQGHGSISLGLSYGEHPAELVEFAISATPAPHKA
ncbi:MAG: adenylate/guanylate cyclase domain-containing protein [Nitrosomonadales bacterium]|nr:adenylate/guanylate cyclase domain-containing protein [Nitrosomonadales bacterium]